MSKNVFANGNEVSAKKDDNKSIAAMADVCLSPPSPPAGPLPIPYPNTAQASDTTDGSKTVKVGGDEVGMKNSSSYKQSNGDEAATKSFGMGVVSHNIQGKMKHSAWSFDVKIEGANAIRHMDLTTHNHTNQGNVALTMNAAGMAVAIDKPYTCEELESQNETTRENDLQRKRGTTTTTGSYTATNGGVTAHSQIRGTTPMDNVRPGREGGLVPGRPSTQTYPCSHRQMQRTANNHTESKMINQIFANAPRPRPADMGTLRMNIVHQSRGSNTSDQWVCPSCREVICAAVKCGLKIELCEDGDEVSSDDVAERCKTKSGWPGA